MLSPIDPSTSWEPHNGSLVLQRPVPSQCSRHRRAGMGSLPYTASNNIVQIDSCELVLSQCLSPCPWKSPAALLWLETIEAPQVDFQSFIQYLYLAVSLWVICWAEGDCCLQNFEHFRPKIVGEHCILITKIEGRLCNMKISLKKVRTTEVAV